MGLKGAAFALLMLSGVTLAACGGSNADNGTIFILPSPSGSAVSAASPAATAGNTSASPTPAAPANSPTPLAEGRIIIDNPDGGSPISSPVDVSGTASVANGTVVAVVLGPDGNELGRATATASASAPDWGHYDVTVNFTGATSGASGKIKVYGVAANGTTPTWYYFIVVHFA
jgi:hypothetical protein